MSATNRSDKRIPNDEYQTPFESIYPILYEINWDNISNVLEPCVGDGNIIEAIYNVTIPENDVLITNYYDIKNGQDYLQTQNEIKEYDLIITNPPFSLALEFLQKSLKEAKTVIYLLRLAFLESNKRKEFWNLNQHQLSHLFVLSKRPSFTGEGTDATAYGWFVFRGESIMKRKNGIYVV